VFDVQGGAVNIQAYLNKKFCCFREYLTELIKEIIAKSIIS